MFCQYSMDQRLLMNYHLSSIQTEVILAAPTLRCTHAAIAQIKLDRVLNLPKD